MTSTSISGFQPRFCPRVGGVDALVRNLPTSSFVEHSSRWQRSGDEKKISQARSNATRVDLRRWTATR